MSYGDPKRDFHVLTHNETGDTIEAHKVTEDTAGEVRIVGVPGVRDANPGDVLVKTTVPDVYDVYSAKDFDELSGAYGRVNDRAEESDEAPEESDEQGEPFRP